MWEEIKKKIMRLFASEVEKREVERNKDFQSENQTVDQLDNKSNVHTRISYQYPSERNFRFPVIPDAPSRTNEQKKPVRNRKDNWEPITQFNEKEQIEEKKTVNKKPFEVTNIPSPIYGFQNRPKNNEDLEVPTFLRKEDRKPSENTFPDEIVNKGLTSVPEANEQQQMEIEKDNMSYAAEDPIEENLSTSTEEESNESGEEVAGVMQEIEVQEQSTLNLVEDADDANSKVTTQEKANRRKASPFNVIMTPRDKKARFDSSQKQTTQTIVQTFKRPPIHLLNDPKQKATNDAAWINEQKELLTTTLKHFHVKAKVVNAMSGPAVTRFEIQPEPGVKVSKIKNLSDDIKLNMAAKDIRMEAPIPGKNTIGIEVPNLESKPVVLQEIFETETFKSHPSPLSVALGLDIAGKPIITDLKKMPHGLIAGATGSGKSVCINTILVSLLYKASHEDVRFLLIDPKMVELAPYNDLPHLVSPVITDVKAATAALKWAVTEMDERYEKFVHEGARDIERYNQKMQSQQRPNEKLPYLVIVIDELADLMMLSPQDVEESISRIAQKARACGIHLLLATQRPSVDVITGLIKANIPTRIAFSVSSQVDSRTIIDSSGAEKLLGKGDMLFVENGAGKSVRIQGAFVTDDEIERITNYVKRVAPPQYLFEQEQLLNQWSTNEEEDELFGDAVEFVVKQNGASASLLQRRFKVGYNRAARLIDHMETSGIISAQKGSKPRDVLIADSDLEKILTNDRSNS